MNQMNLVDIAKRIGCINHNNEIQGGNDLAELAIIEMLGSQTINMLVEEYVYSREARELARSILWVLHPLQGMQRCYEIYQEETEEEYKMLAIDLLRFICDTRGLKWFREILYDVNESIQYLCSMMLDQILLRKFTDFESIEEYINDLQNHPNIQVRELYQFLITTYS